MKMEALPKGFRFRPTDEELISHHLRLKINGHQSAVEVIPEVDVCKWEPWDLPALSVIKSDDPEWFFFCPRDRKYSNGHRSNRATEAGYWKATGKDRSIKSHKPSPSHHSNTHFIGTKKTLVFYRGRAPKGERTNWIMREYRAIEPDLEGTAPGQSSHVLCRLFHKADVKLESSKYDKAELTGSSPSISKSSPEDVSSDLVQEPVALDTKPLKEAQGKKTWWADEACCITPMVPFDSSASDAFDHIGEADGMEVYAPLKNIPIPERAACSEFDDKLNVSWSIFSSIDSPFRDDFGSDSNGLHFHDGTSEQDVSISEVLGKFYEVSTGQKNSIATSESHLPVCPDGQDTTPFAICKGQTSPSFFQVPPSIDHGPLNGTGIKIRPRLLPTESSTVNSVDHGTASRRIHLWMNCGMEFVHGEDPEDACNKELISDATSSICEPSQSECTEGSDYDEGEEVCESSDKKLGLLVKCAKKNQSTTLFACGGAGHRKVYAFGIYLILILSVFSLGMWYCPKPECNVLLTDFARLFLSVISKLAGGDLCAHFV